MHRLISQVFPIIFSPSLAVRFANYRENDRKLPHELQRIIGNTWDIMSFENDV